jgi:PAS domain S-box-containing protein
MADGAPDAGHRFRDLIDFVPDSVVVVDQTGRILLANRQIQELLGFEPGELIGQPLELLLPERFRSRHVEHRGAYVEDPRPRAMGANLALFARRKDGTELPVEISLSPVHEPGGLVTVAAMRDISERRRMQEALRASEERLRLLVESVREYAIYMLDPEGRIRTWSAGAERIHGYSASQILGKHFAAFYPPEEAAASRPQRELAAAVRDGQYREEGWRMRADGSRFQADVTVTPLFDADGGLRGFAKVTRDITERKQAEAERDRATLAREELLALLSHDLQNAVNVLGLNTQLLLRVQAETEAETRMRRYGLALERSTETMSRLIGDLLDLQQIEQGTFRIDPQPEAMASLVQDALEPMQALAFEKGVELEVKLGDTGTALCDRERIVQVLHNLVGNAIKFVPAGGRVVVEAGRDENDVRLAVRDTGPGIQAEDLPHVFERHWQGTSHALRRGSGLGLYIVKTIVEAHGGRVWVESTPGHGASFLFALPAAPPESSGSAPLS